MLQFETPVKLGANASAAEISARLNSLVAAPRSFARSERLKPLRGRVSVEGGFLRWPLNERRFVSPRNLKFKLLELEDGTVLLGKFVIWQPLRIVVLAWLACGLAFWTWSLIHELLHHAGIDTVGRDFLNLVIGCCMAVGYLVLVVFLGRRRDRDLIRVLRIVLAGETEANIVARLLTQNTENDLSFIDPS